MGKIILLDEQLSNKINAGEVVERPASVVKELVENAIDANSTIIEVELEEAGLSKIRVIDNGDGIEPDDVLKAFERHATSKIKNETDLFRIQSLGFRGEALPSIAAVSKVEVITSTGQKEGTRLVIEGGNRKIFEPAQSRKGTDFTVTQLFYNTPARLKYLKTIHTELGNITDIMNRLALSHPNIAMKLIHNDRILLQTNGNGDPRQVLAAIYGFNIVKKMIPFQAQNLDFKVSGYLALPEITRASRNYISTIINGRYIKNIGITSSVINGYHTLLPIGRYPLALINIELDPVLIDVNVHPSKMEIRLSKEQELNQLIVQAIQDAFRKQTLIPSGNVPRKINEKTEQMKLTLDHLPHLEKPLKSFEEDLTNIKPQEMIKNVLEETRKYPVTNTEELSGTKSHLVEDLQTAETNSDDSEHSNGLYQDFFGEKEDRMKGSEVVNQLPLHEDMESQPSNRIPPLYPIGQLHGTYILAQNENGLYIIDQHAAQERIKYEYFKEKLGEVSNDMQQMLIPMTLTFSNDECIKLNEHLRELESVGVILEPFGGNSFIVRSHPVWFPKGYEEETIREIIDQVLKVKKVDLKKLREETAIMMSCKGSIKANHHLRNDEITSLLDTLRQSSDPFTCPHGRPIIIHFSTYDMEKMFKRVM